MSTVKTLTTADELLQMPKDGYRYELIEGELKRMSPAGGKHGAVIGRFTGRLQVHVEDNNLGEVFGAETGYKNRVNPDNVIAPDVSFISREKMLEEDIPDGYLTIAPNLVVEVTSPRDTKKDILNKAVEWLVFGVTVVIAVDPRKRIIQVYRAATNLITLTEQDTLVLDDIVPGFSYPVAKLFLKKKNKGE